MDEIQLFKLIQIIYMNALIANILRKLIVKVLSKYIQGDINEQILKLHLDKGFLVLENFYLKTQLFENHDSNKSSNVYQKKNYENQILIKKAELKIPWSNIFKQKIKLNITQIDVEFTIQNNKQQQNFTKYKQQFSNHKIKLILEMLFSKIVKNTLQDKAIFKSNNQNYSYSASLINKIVIFVIKSLEIEIEEIKLNVCYQKEKVLQILIGEFNFKSEEQIKQQKQQQPKQKLMKQIDEIEKVNRQIDKSIKKNFFLRLAIYIFNKQQKQELLKTSVNGQLQIISNEVSNQNNQVMNSLSIKLNILISRVTVKLSYLNIINFVNRIYSLSENFNESSYNAVYFNLFNQENDGPYTNMDQIIQKPYQNPLEKTKSTYYKQLFKYAVKKVIFMYKYEKFRNKLIKITGFKGEENLQLKEQKIEKFKKDIKQDKDFLKLIAANQMSILQLWIQMIKSSFNKKNIVNSPKKNNEIKKKQNATSKSILQMLPFNISKFEICTNLKQIQMKFLVNKQSQKINLEIFNPFLKIELTRVCNKNKIEMGLDYISVSFESFQAASYSNNTNIQFSSGKKYIKQRLIKKELITKLISSQDKNIYISVEKFDENNQMNSAQQKVNKVNIDLLIKNLKLNINQKIILSLINFLNCIIPNNMAAINKNNSLKKKQKRKTSTRNILFSQQSQKKSKEPNHEQSKINQASENQIYNLNIKFQKLIFNVELIEEQLEQQIVNTFGLNTMQVNYFSVQNNKLALETSILHYITINSTKKIQVIKQTTFKILISSNQNFQTLFSQQKSNTASTNQNNINNQYLTPLKLQKLNAQQKQFTLGIQVKQSDGTYLHINIQNNMNYLIESGKLLNKIYVKITKLLKSKQFLIKFSQKIGIVEYEFNNDQAIKSMKEYQEQQQIIILEDNQYYYIYCDFVLYLYTLDNSELCKQISIQQLMSLLQQNYQQIRFAEQNQNLNKNINFANASDIQFFKEEYKRYKRRLTQIQKINEQIQNQIIIFTLQFNFTTCVLLQIQNKQKLRCYVTLDQIKINYKPKNMIQFESIQQILKAKIKNIAVQMSDDNQFVNINFVQLSLSNFQSNVKTTQKQKMKTVEKLTLKIHIKQFFCNCCQQKLRSIKKQFLSIYSKYFNKKTKNIEQQEEFSINNILLTIQYAYINFVLVRKYKFFRTILRYMILSYTDHSNLSQIQQINQQKKQINFKSEVEIYDLTSYPYTRFVQQQIQLLKSVLYYDNIVNQFELKINDIELFYIHQVYMRVINYLLQKWIQFGEPIFFSQEELNTKNNLRIILTAENIKLRLFPTNLLIKTKHAQIIYTKIYQKKVFDSNESNTSSKIKDKSNLSANDSLQKMIKIVTIAQITQQIDDQYEEQQQNYAELSEQSKHKQILIKAQKYIILYNINKNELSLSLDTIQLRLNKSEYNMIIKFIYNNLLYTDYCDEIFKNQKEISSKQKKNEENLEQNSSYEIKLTFNKLELHIASEYHFKINLFKLLLLYKKINIFESFFILDFQYFNIKQLISSNSNFTNLNHRHGQFQFKEVEFINDLQINNINQDHVEQQPPILKTNHNIQFKTSILKKQTQEQYSQQEEQGSQIKFIDQEIQNQESEIENEKYAFNERQKQNSYNSKLKHKKIQIFFKEKESDITINFGQLQVMMNFTKVCDLLNFLKVTHNDIRLDPSNNMDLDHNNKENDKENNNENNKENQQPKSKISKINLSIIQDKIFLYFTTYNQEIYVLNTFLVIHYRSSSIQDAQKNFNYGRNPETNLILNSIKIQLHHTNIFPFEYQSSGNQKRNILNQEQLQLNYQEYAFNCIQKDYEQEINQEDRENRFSDYNRFQHNYENKEDKSNEKPKLRYYSLSINFENKTRLFLNLKDLICFKNIGETQISQFMGYYEKLSRPIPSTSRTQKKPMKSYRKSSSNLLKTSEKQQKSKRKHSAEPDLIIFQEQQELKSNRKHNDLYNDHIFRQYQDERQQQQNSYILAFQFNFQEIQIIISSNQSQYLLPLIQLIVKKSQKVNYQQHFGKMDKDLRQKKKSFQTNAEKKRHSQKNNQKKHAYQIITGTFNDNLTILVVPFKFFLGYFNLSASKIEPIIESVDIIIQLCHNATIQPQFFVCILIPSLLINISDEMYYTFINGLNQFRSIREKLLKSDRESNNKLSSIIKNPFKNENIFSNIPSNIRKRAISVIENDVNKIPQKNEVTLFSFKNETGITVKVYENNVQKILKKNLQKIFEHKTSDNYLLLAQLLTSKMIYYKVPEKQQNNFQQNFEKSVKFRIEFQDNNQLNYYIANQIKINNLLKNQTYLKYYWINKQTDHREKQLRLKRDSDKKEKSHTKTNKIIHSNYFIGVMSISHNKKQFILKSRFYLKNQTDVQIYFQFKSSKSLKNQELIYSLKPEGILPLPFYIYNNKQMQYRIANNSNQATNQQYKILNELILSQKQIEQYINRYYQKNIQNAFENPDDTILEDRNQIMIESKSIKIYNRYQIFLILEIKSKIQYITIVPMIRIFNNIPLDIQLISLNLKIEANSIKFINEYDTIKQSIIRLSKQYQTKKKVLFYSSYQFEQKQDVNQQSIIKLDYIGNGIYKKELKINMYRKKKKGIIQIIFSTRTILVNETNLDLIFWLNQIKCIDKIILANQDDILRIEPLRNQNITKSINLKDIANLTDVSYEQKVKKDNEDQYRTYQLNLCTLLYESEYSNQIILTKVIEITPKYILQNKTPYVLQINQPESFMKGIQFKPHQKNILYWQDKRLDQKSRLTTERKLVIRIIQKDPNSYFSTKWKWSGSFEVQHSRTIHTYIKKIGLVKTDQEFMLQSRSITKEAERKYFRIQIKRLSSYTCIIIDEIPQNQIQIIISNNTKYKLLLQQKNDRPVTHKDYFYIRPKKKCVFGWIQPDLKKKIIICLLIQGIIVPLNIELSIQVFPFQKQVQVPQIKQSLLIRMKFKDRKFIEIYEVSNKTVNLLYGKVNLKQKYDSKIVKKRQKYMTLLIPEIGISIIGMPEKTKLEIFFIKISIFEIIYYLSDKVKIELRLRELNIDNNIRNQAFYPIFLTSARNLDAHYEFFFQFILEQQMQIISSTNKINELKIYINPLTIKMDEYLATNLLLLYKKIQKFNNENFQTHYSQKEKFQTITYVFSNPAKKLEILKHINNPFCQWKQKQLKFSKKFILLKVLEVPNLQINLSFNNSHSLKNNTKKLFGSLYATFGIAIPNFQNAPIKISGFKAEDILDATQQVLIGQLFRFYKYQIISNILSIIGSFQIFGNPMGLIIRVKHGFIELIRKPRIALKKGRGTGAVISAFLSGILGVIRNCFAGTIHVVHSLTGSVSGALAWLSFDDQFIDKRRQNNRYQAENILKGIQYGLQSVIYGFQSAIKGINPKSRRYPQGFGIVTVKAISGIMTKPLCGIIDGLNHSIKGIQNMITQEIYKSKQDRERPRRIFYEHIRYFKQYRQDDVNLLQFLINANQKKFKNTHLIEFFKYQIFGKKYRLVITIQNIIMIENQIIIWCVDPLNVQLETKKIDIDAEQISQIMLKQIKGQTKYTINVLGSDMSNFMNSIHKTISNLNYMSKSKV